MNNYAPLFSEIVQSSLWTEPYFVRVLFTSMLAMQDADHVVRGSAFNIASRAHMEEAEVLEGLKILSEPDRRRLEPQPHEGRRIEKVGKDGELDSGWLILNGEKYQEWMRAANRRWYQAVKQREYRAKRASAGPLPGEVQAVAALGRGDKETADKLAAERIKQ